MTDIVVAGLTVDERQLALKAKLIEKGFNPADIHEQVIRAMVLLSNDDTSPKVQLSQLHKDSITAQDSVPGQILIAKSDGFAYSSGLIGFRKTATLAEVPNQITFTYADKALFAGAGENDCIQGFFSAGEMSMNVSGKPVMQPLAASFFENIPMVVNTATEHPFYSDRGKNEKYTIWPGGFRILDGGTENRVDFNLKGSVDAIGTNNYLVVELLGYRLHNQSNLVEEMAGNQNVCTL